MPVIFMLLNYGENIVRQSGIGPILTPSRRLYGVGSLVQVLGERLPTQDVQTLTGLVCTQVTVTKTSKADTWQVRLII